MEESLLASIRSLAASFWVTLCLLVALWYLTGSFQKSGLVTVIFAGFLATGVETQWLRRGAFVVSVIAIAVYLGMPHPEHWREFLRNLVDTVSQLKSNR
jgi:hypothetical protein